MTDTKAPRSADEYRKLAADCREQSERAPNQFHKENWLKIAGKWEHLAEIAEKHA
jgi:hypothetical protein